MRRFLKFPYKVPFAWPDEAQPDGIPVSAKPPPSFEVQYEGEQDLTLVTRTSAEWRRLHAAVPQPPQPVKAAKKAAAEGEAAAESQ